MKDINTYLTFDGNCAQAMRFYEKCLKADLHMMPFSEMPGEVAPESKNRIMHARLTKGTATLLASDTMPGHPYRPGNNFSISLNCESKQEVDDLVSQLKQGGNVTMTPQETFWGAYFAMLVDQFGVQWMFNHDMPRK